MIFEHETSRFMTIRLSLLVEFLRPWAVSSQIMVCSGRDWVRDASAEGYAGRIEKLGLQQTASRREMEGKRAIQQQK